MRIRQDGSVQSSNTPTYQNVGSRQDYGIYRCMVTKVVYVDDPANITANSSNPRVLYEVVVLGGFSSGQVISNCRLASLLGGNYNYYERTLRAASRDVSKTRLSDSDGDIVFVMFNQGNDKFPVIIALDEGIGTGSATGASTSDAQVERFQYNGIFSQIDKSGNFKWIRKGGTFDSTLNAFVPSSSEDVKAEVGPSKITVTMKNGMTVTIDGNTDTVKVLTKGGAKAEINGSSGTIHLKDNGTGALKITGSKVALGASSAELLKQISDALQALITAWTSEASHTHIGNLGYPTAPPSNAGDDSTASSTLSTIKGLVDGIKGTL